MNTALRPLLGLAALAILASGCSKNEIAIPREICGVPVKSSALSPLIPDGEELKKNEPFPIDSDPAYCDIYVDGTHVLNITVRMVDEEPRMEDWKDANAKYALGAPRKIPFAGSAVIGSDGALVNAECGSPANYVLLDVRFKGDRVERSEAGVQKLQRFIEDFTPGVRKKIGCIE